VESVECDQDQVARQEHRISGRGRETGAGKELDLLDLGPPEPMDL